MFYKVKLHSPQQPCGGKGSIFVFNLTLMIEPEAMNVFLSDLKVNYIILL